MAIAATVLICQRCRTSVAEKDDDGKLRCPTCGSSCDLPGFTTNALVFGELPPVPKDQLLPILVSDLEFVVTAAEVARKAGSSGISFALVMLWASKVGAYGDIADWLGQPATTALEKMAIEQMDYHR